MRTITRKDPQPIDKVLKNLWKKIERKKEEKLKQEEILKRLKGVVGKKLISHLKLQSLRKGVLLIEVDNSLCLSELYMKRKEIIETVNAISKKKTIEKVNFRIRR